MPGLLHYEVALPVVLVVDAKGMAASPGAAVGKAVFDSATAKAWADRGEDVILGANGNDTCIGGESGAC